MRLSKLVLSLIAALGLLGLNACVEPTASNSQANWGGGGIDFDDIAHDGDDQSGNGNDDDDDDTTPPTTLPAAGQQSAAQIARRAAALAVLDAKCMSCHATAGGNGQSPRWDRAQWNNDAYWTNVVQDVFRSNSTRSLLVAKSIPIAATTAIMRTVLTAPTRNMPRGGGAPFTIDEARKISDWINLMEEPNTVSFNIAPGTGNQSWNTSANFLDLKLGNNLRVCNNDPSGQAHTIHTNNTRPFPHGQQIALGGCSEYLLQNAMDSSTNASPDLTYNHEINANVRFYMKVTP